MGNASTGLVVDVRGLTPSQRRPLLFAIIDKMLATFVGRLIAPLRRQLAISGPKRLCASSHWCSLSDDFANATAATRTNGVVGSKGSRIPAPPSASEKKPIASQVIRAVESTSRLTAKLVVVRKCGIARRYD